MADLTTELEHYRNILPSLKDQEGKFIVITGKDVLGIFDSYSDALKIGYQKVGLDPFLVKKISTDEVISYFSRDILAHVSPLGHN
ncbi:MAG: hypothetical protein ACM3YN_07720 [Parcubacteria group bacterium]